MHTLFSPWAGPAFWRRMQGPLRPWLVTLLGFLWTGTSLPAEVFVVTNRVDGQPGSLREALRAANQSPGLDGIWFRLPGAPPFVLSVQSNLPAITDSIFIDGTSQPGYRARPVVELAADSAGTATDGLVLVAAGNTVRGLAIGGFSRAGLVLREGGGNVLMGNHVGVDASGTQAKPNHFGILIEQGAPFNTIGSETDSDRNLISGNVVGLAGAETAGGGQVVLGNWMGLDRSGLRVLGNTHGIAWTNASSCTYGGIASGAGNVISGNDAHGLILVGGNGNVIQGNLVGLDPAGGVTLGNGGSGIVIQDAGYNTVGGAALVAGNVVSGNSEAGIALRGVGSVGNVLQSNFLGVDGTGLNPRPNHAGGLVLEDGASFNTVGGGSEESGSSSSSGNVISANGLAGVIIRGAGTDGNVMQGNRVGLGFESAESLPNDGPGVVISGGAMTLLGGLEPGQGNRIAFNLGDGILIQGGSDVAGHLVSRNAVYDNVGLPLNLQPEGEPSSLPTLNDAGDADAGPNGLQNHPEILSVAQSNGVTRIEGVLHAAPDASYEIDVYHHRGARGDGRGDAEGFAGFVVVDTAETGEGFFAVEWDQPDWMGRSFSATAIDLETGDTSEFSLSVRDATAGPVVSVLDTAMVEATDTGVMVFRVVLSAASEQPVTVQFETDSDTGVAHAAEAGLDYGPLARLLTFAPGQTMQEVAVSIMADTEDEGYETFFAVLTTPTQAALRRARATATIVDNPHATIHAGENGMALSFVSAPGVAYRWERAARLGAGSWWRPLAGWTRETSTGEDLSMVDETSRRSRAGYYRLRLLAN